MPPSRSSRPGGWATRYAVELAFLLLVVVAFAYAMRISGETYFWADDWLLIRQGRTIGGIFDAYNGHLSVVILVVYRFLIDVFGVAHTPFQVVGTLALLSVSVAYFLHARRTLGATVAAILAMPLLWASGMDLFAAAQNHYFALLGGVGCAMALDRGRRADWVLAASLAFSLLSAGGGVAVAAACVAHNACVRPPLRRWLAVLAPSALWAVWWLTVARSQRVDLGTPTWSEMASFARDLGYSAFESIALGNEIAAVGVLAALAVYGLWRLRQGLDAAANVIAWSAALVVWACGLAYSRGDLADVAAFRYQFPAMGFILLAVVPRRPIRWPERVAVLARDRWLAAAAVLVLVLGGARGLAVRDDLQDFSRLHTAIGRQGRAETMLLGLGPSVIPDDKVLSFGFSYMTAGEARMLLDRHGQPFPESLETADDFLVEVGVVRAVPSGRLQSPCQPEPEPIFVVESGALRLWSDDPTWSVEVRRFGDEWLPLGQGRGNQVLTVRLASLSSDQPWEVRATDACRLERARPHLSLPPATDFSQRVSALRSSSTTRSASASTSSV